MFVAKNLEKLLSIASGLMTVCLNCICKAQDYKTLIKRKVCDWFFCLLLVFMTLISIWLSLQVAIFFWLISLYFSLIYASLIISSINLFLLLIGIFFLTHKKSAPHTTSSSLCLLLITLINAIDSYKKADKEDDTMH